MAMKPWQKSKPYSQEPGYVASAKARLGGWMVVYDGELRRTPAADQRWIVQHEPSGKHVGCTSEAAARELMKLMATARWLEEADGTCNELIPHRKPTGHPMRPMDAMSSPHRTAMQTRDRAMVLLYEADQLADGEVWSQNVEQAARNLGLPEDDPAIEIAYWWRIAL